jgi:hypothetical protein
MLGNIEGKKHRADICIEGVRSTSGLVPESIADYGRCYGWHHDAGESVRYANHVWHVA